MRYLKEEFEKDNLSATEKLKVVKSVVEDVVTELETRNDFRDADVENLVNLLEMAFDEADEAMMEIHDGNRMEYVRSMTFANALFGEKGLVDEGDGIGCLAAALDIKLIVLHDMFEREFKESVIGEKDRIFELLQDVITQCDYMISASDAINDIDKVLVDRKPKQPNE